MHNREVRSNEWDGSKGLYLRPLRLVLTGHLPFNLSQMHRVPSNLAPEAIGDFSLNLQENHVLDRGYRISVDLTTLTFLFKHEKHRH